MKLRARASSPQAQLVNTTSKFPAMVAGFGAGKTEALTLRGLNMMFGNSRDVAYYLPTYDLVRTIGYPRWEEKLENIGVPYKLNKSDKTITFNNKTLFFRTMENPDRIVGYEVGDSLVDELDTLPKEKARTVWNKIIARNRQKKAVGINTVAVGTTPEGFRFVYDQWYKDASESYELIRAPTRSNKHLPDDYIASLEETYPAQLLAAYLEGEFVNLAAGTVYSEFNRDFRNTSKTWDGREAVHIGMDFNVYNMSAVVHVVRDDVAYAVDEITKGVDTPQMIEIIKQRYAGASIIIYPDASGRNTSSKGASLSDITLLKGAGFKIDAPKANPFVKDRVLAMNIAFKQGKYFVNVEKCPEYSLCLEQQVYNTNNEPDKSQGHDHLPDSGGYFINRKFPVKNRKPKTIQVMGI